MGWIRIKKEINYLWIITGLLFFCFLWEDMVLRGLYDESRENISSFQEKQIELAENYLDKLNGAKEVFFTSNSKIEKLQENGDKLREKINLAKSSMAIQIDQNKATIQILQEEINQLENKLKTHKHKYSNGLPVQ